MTMLEEWWRIQRHNQTEPNKRFGPLYTDSAGLAAWHILHRGGKLRPVMDMNKLHRNVQEVYREAERQACAAKRQSGA